MFSHSNQNDDVVFMVTGLRNCKKFLEKMGKHIEFKSHKECQMQWVSFKQSASQPELTVERYLGRQTETEINNNRLAVSTLARIVLLYGR